jgi:GST-like protein
MNNRLFDRRYLAGDEYTIADMISYPWTVGWEAQGENLDDFPYFKRWFDELSSREGVARGMAVGSDLSVDYSKLGRTTSSDSARCSTTNALGRRQKAGSSRPSPLGRESVGP